MAKLLNEKDHEVVKKLREAHVLQDVADHLLDQSNGVILVTCADGDRFADVFQRQCTMQAQHRSTPRVHTLSWHGGALACAPCSPVNRRKRTAAIFTEQVLDAVSIKGILTVALYGHGPCGAAGAAGVDIPHSIALQMRTKRRLKTEDPRLVVAPFFHVDFGGGKQRTYFLHRERWDVWAEKHGLRTIC